MIIMRNYSIEISNANKKIYQTLQNFNGDNGAGETIGFTNYYMEINNKPFFGIAGEYHFSRYHHSYWEDELIKMKMGGINIVSTYIFWNHHEEVEGEFNWNDDKNLRRFIELCRDHNLYVIVRIGPFNHGEARNGGLPDWLFGRPFDLRSNDEGYLFFVKRFYKEIGNQIKDLLYKDGGPIIGTQLENEYQHAASPWELTTGTSNEWLPSGKDGDAHIKKLKEMALKLGIETPIYTGTGWGGAIAPTDEVLPLWGGYAYWPWIFYGNAEKHPLTPNYIFRDYHNNKSPKTFDFEPSYKPESIPFACAEMMGGMTAFYNYRFALPFESVDALSSIKVAGGCNFIGYYMYHGGSNPKGKNSYFLNEAVAPKISYDFQAPIGEFGQVRESYHRLKRQHLFYQQYQEQFTQTKTFLAKDPALMQPEDIKDLRYAARVKGRSGFLYINNFQDHIETEDQNDFSISLNIEGEIIRLPENGALSIAKDANCILPFNFDMEGVNLNYATTQLITELNCGDEKYYFFFSPKGMASEYSIDNTNLREINVEHGVLNKYGTKTIVKTENRFSKVSLIKNDGFKINICTMSDEDSLKFWKVNLNGQERILITDANVLITNNQLRLEFEEVNQVSLKVFPEFEGGVSFNGKNRKGTKSGLFTEYIIDSFYKDIDLELHYISDCKATIKLDEQSFKNIKEIFLKIDYVGDIGYAFINGELINDNFCNTRTWEIGLKRFEKELIEEGMYIYISPLKSEASIKSDSPMAARTEIAEEKIAKITSIRASLLSEVEVIY